MLKDIKGAEVGKISEKRKNKNPERQIIPSKNNAKTPANSLYSAPSEHKINGHEFEIISNKVIFSSLKNYFEKLKKKLQT